MRRIDRFPSLRLLFVYTLCLAVVVPTSTAGAQNITTPLDNWRLNLTVKSGQLTDNAIQLGVDPQATDGFDPNFDVTTPPLPVGPFIQGSFPHDTTQQGWEKNPGFYSTDIRSPIKPGQTDGWRLQVSTNLGTDQTQALVEVSWPDLIKTVPDGITLLLRDPADLDKDGKREYDMRSISNFNFFAHANGEEANYPLVIIAGLKASPRLLGDINGDGVVNIQDAILTLRSAVGLVALGADQEAAADINDDGAVDVRDVTLMLNLVAGIPLPPPPAAARDRPRFVIEPFMARRGCR